MLKKKQIDPYYSIQVSNANTILINSIREIKREISFSTLNNDWKIYLIFQAEKLCSPNPASGHALLKLLEEPPLKTLFILVSSKPDTILDTIHSRCQKMYFPQISKRKLENQLIKNGIDQNEAVLIAQISGGNINIC